MSGLPVNGWMLLESFSRKPSIDLKESYLKTFERVREKTLNRRAIILEALDLGLPPLLFFMIVRYFVKLQVCFNVIKIFLGQTKKILVANGIPNMAAMVIKVMARLSKISQNILQNQKGI